MIGESILGPDYVQLECDHCGRHTSVVKDGPAHQLWCCVDDTHVCPACGVQQDIAAFIFSISEAMSPRPCTPAAPCPECAAKTDDPLPDNVVSLLKLGDVLIKKTETGHQVVSKDGRALSKDGLTRAQAKRRLQQVRWWTERGAQ